MSEVEGNVILSEVEGVLIPPSTGLSVNWAPAFAGTTVASADWAPAFAGMTVASANWAPALARMRVTS